MLLHGLFGALVSVALAAGAVAAAGEINAKDLGAAGDGATDDTAAIQAALDQAGAAGGGVVSLPSGKYRLDGHLTIPTGVTLSGVWEAPHFSTPEVGTVLLAYEGRGQEDGPPLLMLETNSTVRGLTVVYPEQRASQITAYPWTIQGRGTHLNVSDVTLLNPYKGIDFGTYAHEMHYIRNVYGCPLKIGVHLDKCTDIGRVENVHFNPNSWTRSGMDTAPQGDDGARLVEYMQANLVAFEIGRSDWEFMLNTFSWGCRVGYRFFESEAGPTNGNFLGIAADWAVIPLLVESTQPPGLLITNGEFVGSPACEAVVRIAPSNSGVVQLANCSFWGPHQKIVEAAGNGLVSLSQCNFCQWANRPPAEGADPVPAIDVISGSATISGCLFQQAKDHIRLREGVVSAVVMGNHTRGPARFIIETQGDVQVLGNVVRP
ncbi:MAG TPA: glycosyl hydrolase family 28-related protein [Armatimonadota bacterium]|nr:glycosyl hydrolase family 28-related protein [Armatimonadota bacterium]